MDLQHLLDEAGDSFHEKLFELIDKSGMSDVEVYKSACIDRRLEVIQLIIPERVQCWHLYLH